VSNNYLYGRLIVVLVLTVLINRSAGDYMSNLISWDLHVTGQEMIQHSIPVCESRPLKGPPLKGVIWRAHVRLGP